MTNRAVIRFGGFCLAGGAPRTRKWLGWFGVGTAAFGFIGMFRNVTSAVAPIAELNNYLLPAFMIVLGVALVRWLGSAEEAVVR